MMRRLLVALCGLLLLGGAGVVAAGEAGAAPLLICSPHGNLRATGSGTSTAHLFYYYECNQDPAAAGVASIVEYMAYESVDGTQFDYIPADRPPQRTAKTELTLCTHSGCSFSPVPAGSYRMVLELDIFGTASNGDTHCTRANPGDPIHCTFESGTFTLV